MLACCAVWRWRQRPDGAAVRPAWPTIPGCAQLQCCTGMTDRLQHQAHAPYFAGLASIQGPCISAVTDPAYSFILFQCYLMMVQAAPTASSCLAVVPQLWNTMPAPCFAVQVITSASCNLCCLQVACLVFGDESSAITSPVGYRGQHTLSMRSTKVR